MSLKAFHIFFIGVCGLFCLVLMVWGGVEWRRTGGAGALVYSVLGAGGAAALKIYLSRFLAKGRGPSFPPSKLNVGLAVFGVAALWPHAAQACAVCFGNAPDVKRAMGWGIVVLGGFTVLAVGGLWAMMLRLIRAKDEKTRPSPADAF